jgi:hypothetical protein
MTTFTPDPTAATRRALKESVVLKDETPRPPIHVTNCKCIFAGHASEPDPRCVAAYDAHQLQAVKPALVSALREDLAREFPIPLKEQYVSGRITTTGTETELRARWAKLMKAESVLQNARAEIETLLDEAPSHEVGEAGTDIQDFVERIRTVLAEQNTRPSPDYRALMVRAHEQLEKILEHFATTNQPTDVNFGGLVRPALKEALRLTDVERLAPWSGSAQGRAMLFVVNDLIEELGDIADGAHDPLEDEVWIEQTKLDLEEARDKPEEYLARMAQMRPRRRQ